MTDHYDIAIIGSGAGGGTLAYALAATGKKILILERGGWLPREKENWKATRLHCLSPASVSLSISSLNTQLIGGLPQKICPIRRTGSN